MRADVSVQCASMDAQEYLNAPFPVRWFGRDDQFLCPTSIPPLFFFFVRGHLRCSVYETPVEQEGVILSTVPTESTRLIFPSDCDSHCCVATDYAMKPHWTAFLEAALPRRLHRIASV